ncbi:hypothetical protein [Methanolapillus ohkumae]|uniref:Uncharacterized protein n=1 Tax=Methanolapillus ohkumae TaxID=3028298 RepID=A0AA96ZWE0_9EURY|nr:hypothetical protein MsAm2_14520 [Methanosarcinaceae archaeon Am2]
MTGLFNQSEKTICFLLVLFLIFFGMTCICFAKEDVRGVEDIRVFTEMPLNDSEIQKSVDQTPPTNPEYFEQVSKSQSALASYGTVPLKTGEDAYDWGLSLQRISRSIQQDQAFEKYLAVNGGPICGYSAGINGFLMVYLNPNVADLKTSQDIENMKQVIEKYAIEEGIEDVPIVFVNGCLNIVMGTDDKYQLKESRYHSFFGFFKPLFENKYFIRFVNH